MFCYLEPLNVTAQAETAIVPVREQIGMCEFVEN